MKQLWFLRTLCLISICWASPLQGQDEVRDSMINETLRDFLKYDNSSHRNSKYMIAAHTFPYDYDLSQWITDRYKIEIANFNDKKTIKQYKKTKDGIPTIYLKCRIDLDGCIIYKVALYYIKIRGRNIDYALSDICTYYYRYSNIEKRWIIVSKSYSGV